ncbi:MAG: bifunctional diaminohydroxyphosphoribosylaminopyrimidine deaminase/5-amino-6-(5-phosphoribosylamino)uracil reductase RibD [Actinomycetota bacterium]|nr:bifunctional diaminohydroxyphosphoribosylaminopyrimidine deaminase/5-amino-6-(5-phosphoribosylamino)uracil reductase RibD [Actinomycetota bacterium]
MTRRVEDNLFPAHRADELMRRAIGLTEGTLPHPNPRVGAIVLTPDGEVVAERAHIRAGSAHAEAAALVDAGSAASGSTVVVTLEPCAHHGRTPPCTTALIEAGVSRVVVGTLDPDPRVAGKGVALLKDAGIEVVVGVEEDAVRSNDPAYYHHRSTGRPFVTLKTALTLDGQAAAADHTSRWVTGPEAREDGHRLRAECGAVLVGAGTVISDDPRLDVRIDGYDGPQPRPVIMAGRRPIQSDAALLSRDPLVFTSGTDQPGLGEVEQVAVPGPDGVDLAAAIEYLGEQGIVAVLIEGGPTIGGAALRAGLVDRIVFHYGSKLGMGTGLPAVAGVFQTITDAQRVTIESVTMVGSDIRVEAKIERET